MVKVYACCKCNVSIYNLMEYKKKCINNPSFYYLSKNLIEIHHSISAWSQNCDTILINVYLRIVQFYWL